MCETCLLASGMTGMRGVVTPPQTAQKVAFVAYVWCGHEVTGRHTQHLPSGTQPASVSLCLSALSGYENPRADWQGHPKGGDGAGELTAPWEQLSTKDWIHLWLYTIPRVPGRMKPQGPRALTYLTHTLYWLPSPTSVPWDQLPSIPQTYKSWSPGQLLGEPTACPPVLLQNHPPSRPVSHKLTPIRQPALKAAPPRVSATVRLLVPPPRASLQINASSEVLGHTWKGAQEEEWSKRKRHHEVADYSYEIGEWLRPLDAQWSPWTALNKLEKVWLPRVFVSN